MKKLFLLICAMGFSVSANALDLGGLKAADLRGGGEELAIPVPSAAVKADAPDILSDKLTATPESAYYTIKEYFGRGGVPSWEMLRKQYEGRTLTPLGDGKYTVTTRSIMLTQKKSVDDLGPLFEDPAHVRMDTFVIFFAPWNIPYKAVLNGDGLDFTQEFDASSAGFKVTFRQYGKHLIMKSTLFGDTYGYFYAID